MIDLIETHVLDLLQGDSRLYAGGNAWSAGFSGALRPANGDTAAAGSGFWYLLELPGQSSAGGNRVWASATGSGAQGVAEALAGVPVLVRYAFTDSSSA